MSKKINKIKADCSKEELDAVEQNRIIAIRETFWNLTPEYKNCSKSSNIIKSAIYSSFELNIDNKQEKLIFDILPSYIIGKIIGYGFEDFETERDVKYFIDSELTYDDIIELLADKGVEKWNNYSN